MRFKLHHKTPLPLVLGILVNIVLVVALEVLIFYRTPLPPTEDLLSKLDTRYEDCQVMAEVNADSNRGVHFYRVKTSDGQTDLIPLKQHSFFPSRTRLYPGKIIKNLDLEADSSTQVLFGAEIYTVFVSDGIVRAMFSAGGSFQQTALVKYMTLGLVLTLVELFILEKLRGE